MTKFKKATAMDFVRRRYGVTARRGMRVSCKTSEDRTARFGEIKGAKGCYLRVLIDGDRRPELFHPVDEVEYPRTS